MCSAQPSSLTCRIKRQGFTLIEVLIVIVIIAGLAAVLFPFISNMKAKQQATQAVHRIRQCGMIVMQNAVDNHNNIVVHANGTSSNMHDLRLYGMVREVTGTEEIGSYVYTPAYESQAKGTWPVWGLNLDDDEENGIKWEKVWFERGGEQRYAEGLSMARCGPMANYPLFADSSNDQGVPRARFANDNVHKFAMRYGGKGPIFFLDGSTRLVGRSEMVNFGITQAYLFEDNPTTDPTLVAATSGSN